VLVENYAPGVIGRLGLDYETVKSINPKIVMCSISAFGQTGPLANEPGFDFLGASYAGIVSMGGEPGGAPYVIMTALGDVSTGAHAMGAICAALLYRERTGLGQYLDLSLLDTYFHYHESGIQSLSLSKGAINPTRSGLHSWYAVPCGVFKAKDRYIFIISPLEHQFTGLCRAMGQPELAIDPRFKTNADRLKNLKELVAAIEGWLQSSPSDDVSMAAMKNTGCRMRRCYRWPRRSSIRICASAERCARYTYRILGDFDVPGFALRFSEFPERLELQAPFLGEHNEQVLIDYLGYSAARVKELQQQRILRSGPA